MVKVVLTSTLIYDEDVLPFIRSSCAVMEEFNDLDHACRYILDFDPLSDENPLYNKRMSEIASNYYYDPADPDKTCRGWTYKIGKCVYYSEVFSIETE